MPLEFLNPAMLWGLAGVSLPIVAHLLSKRRFDVVDWGAMQFLDLGKQRKRRVRIEEMLLLLLRMLLIALLALALARPTISGGIWANSPARGNRDTVLAVDGSYSMGRLGGERTPHRAAQSLLRRMLKRARAGDTFTLLDVRGGIRSAVGQPTRNREAVADAVNRLPPPAGTSDLAGGIARALEILGTTSHARRDVIVLSDGQARGWRLSDRQAWNAIEELRRLPAVEPRIWAVNLNPTQSSPPANYSLDALRLSREIVPVGFPVRVSTTLTYRGDTGVGERNVYLEVDGQRLSGSTLQSPPMQPGSEFGVEFEHRFATAGSHLLSVVLDADEITGDDRAEAAIAVTAPPALLLVDGEPHLDPTRGETFFAQAALQGTDAQPPLVDVRVIAPRQLDTQAARDARVIVLANVARLTETQGPAIVEFVKRGGGLLVAPGRHVEASNYAEMLGDILPAQLIEFVLADPESPGRLDAAQLQFPWPADEEDIADLGTVQFLSYWNVQPADGAELLARLETGEPLMLSSRYGRGRAILLSMPLDAEAGTLPTKSAYVSLLHEMLFYLATSDHSSRNLQVGDPLVLAIPDDQADDQFQIRGPGKIDSILRISGEPPEIRFEETQLPGGYSLERTHQTRAGTAAVETTHFVVEFDRKEADLTPLTVAEREQLSSDHGITFAGSPESFEKQWLADESRTELWQFLLVLVLGLLNLEIWLTRRLVRGGHAVLDAVERPVAE